MIGSACTYHQAERLIVLLEKEIVENPLSEKELKRRQSTKKTAEEQRKKRLKEKQEKYRLQRIKQKEEKIQKRVEKHARCFKKLSR